jgi:hypothetical protein
MPKKHKGKSKIHPQPQWDWPLLLSVIVLSGIALFGMTREFYANILSPDSLQSAPINDPKKVIQPNAVFYTLVYLSRNKTFITFPYRFDHSPQTLWLTLQAKIGEPAIQRLVMHPLLHKLDWHRFETADLTLYQRKKTYNSINDFLKQLPPAKSLMIDDPVITITGKQFPNNPVLDETTTTIPDSVQYILTSFKPQVEKNDWFYFEATLNAETAQPNIKDELVWQLEAPNASEQNPFYLGEIHIDYRQ